MTQSVAGVLFRGNLVLLAKRKPGGDMGGRWELPGGKCEGNEGHERGLRREFREEFGVDIQVGAACASARFRHHGVEHLVTAYLIRTDAVFDHLAEHDEIGWFGLDSLPPRGQLVDSDAELLDQLRARDPSRMSGR
jgi:8-oxo-dGTP diphosphatase